MINGSFGKSSFAPLSPLFYGHHQSFYAIRVYSYSFTNLQIHQSWLHLSFSSKKKYTIFVKFGSSTPSKKCGIAIFISYLYRYRYLYVQLFKDFGKRIKKLKYQNLLIFSRKLKACLMLICSIEYAL